MLNRPASLVACQRGTSMLEVLITATIVSFGLLGLALMQAKSAAAEQEAGQRAQAVSAMSAMTERLRSNPPAAASYVGTFGTGDSQPADCTSVATGYLRDVCEWSAELRGNAEKKAGAAAGGMIGAVGCITQIQAPNPAIGTCTPAQYRVAVAWQGLRATFAPADACGSGNYGTDEKFRRVILSQVTIPMPGCSL